jgi:predicted ATPase
MGSHFSPLLLGAVLDMEITDAERCCDALIRRGQILITDGMEQNPQGEVTCIYAFRHALYVEVLYQRLSARELIRLHLRIGECLEKLHGKNDLKHAAELALHFEKGWAWDRAVFYLTQAAANAARRFANREAYDYLARALAIVERLPEEKQVMTRIDLLKQIWQYVAQYEPLQSPDVYLDHFPLAKPFPHVPPRATEHQRERRRYAPAERP